VPKKTLSAQQIVTLLRQIEVPMAQSKSIPETCRAAEISLLNSAMSCSVERYSTA